MQVADLFLQLTNFALSHIIKLGKEYFSCGGNIMQGLVVIVVAVFVGVITGIFSRVPNQIITPGTVVSTEYKYDSGESKPTYIAIVEYEVDGKIYAVKSRYRSSSYHTGQKMKVGYDSSDPQRSIIKPTVTNYIVFIALLIIGIVFFALSFAKGCNGLWNT